MVSAFERPSGNLSPKSFLLLCNIPSIILSRQSCTTGIVSFFICIHCFETAACLPSIHFTEVDSIGLHLDCNGQLIDYPNKNQDGLSCASTSGSDSQLITGYFCRLSCTEHCQKATQKDYLPGPAINLQLPIRSRWSSNHEIYGDNVSTLSKSLWPLLESHQSVQNRG